MKQIFKIYIPSACISFTLTALLTCISNLLQGNAGIYNAWFLQMFAFIVVVDILDFALGYINFKSYFAYLITEFALTYIAMLGFCYFGNWFSFSLHNLVLISIIFVIVYSSVHFYFYKMSHMQADEINSLLNH
ncbi:MAG: DUF3021 family protein [Lachnospiraceae bacterium]|nr:DUF3021 family protein [Lachnospiraceae bacterium]